ncbi:MAG: Mg-chelatase subunit ChlD [Mariniblastus sp.]|jgi:Mg-chelatase subunit ChlD
MKLSSLWTVVLSLSLLGGLLGESVQGQSGVSSASMGVGRAGFHRVSASGKYLMPKPEMFRVEEFVNFHRHDLRLPEQGSRVRLDVQTMTLENGKTVLQVGLTTPRALDRKSQPPLNIVLVVDESGSMSGDKILNLKEALLAFVERFKPNDKITIVGFEQQARVILESVERTDINEITQAIENIHAGGGTNLHAGLMCGYEMALKHYDQERTNRVIFLTDGNANVGVIESEEIARESKQCIRQGISLVTIGLGVDFNNGLLRDISESGRGVVHYVGDAKDIKKVFVDEIDSVLAPAARNVKLTLNLGEHTHSAKLYGYEPEWKQTSDGPSVVLKFDNLNHGATQVVIARLPDTGRAPIGSVTLSYVDAISRAKITSTANLHATNSKRPQGNQVSVGLDRPRDKTTKPKKSRKQSQRRRDDDNKIDTQHSINRNYTIAILADAIVAASVSSNQGDNKRAATAIEKGIKKMYRMSDHEAHEVPDKHVKRVLKIAENYLEMLEG